MARKISGGLVGSSTLVGSIQISPDAELATAADQNITLSPGGNGQVISTANIQLDAQTDLRFGDADSSNWVALQAPSTIASNVTWTLPAADGTTQQILTTNGTGTLSFTNKSLPITDNTSDASTNFVLFSSASSGDLTAPRTASTKITFVPNEGELAVEGTVRSLVQETIQAGSYTFALTDRSKVVTMNNSSAATVTIPTDSAVAFPIGSEIQLTRIAAGSVTLAAAGGVTVNAGGTGNLALGETVVLRKRAANNWFVNQRPYSVAGTGGSASTVGNVNVHQYTSGTSSFVVGT
jgi:hypothetical protein